MTSPAPLPPDRCCGLAEGEIARLAAVTEGVDPATPVPTCGDWTIADLLVHVGEVYRWAAMTVREAAPERLPREQLDFGVPGDGADLPAWIAAGAADAVASFRAADPDTPMWAWGWPKAARFWPRRMVHEVGVHRADAELALGLEPAFQPEVAADGVDELLGNLPHAAYFRPAVRELRGDGEVLGLQAADNGDSWRITFHAEGFTWARTTGDDPGPATALVEAPAAHLLLGLYGRPADLVVTGDHDLVARWRDGSAL